MSLPNAELFDNALEKTDLEDTDILRLRSPDKATPVERERKVTGATLKSTVDGLVRSNGSRNTTLSVWDTLTPYTVGELVLYEGVQFLAMEDNTGNIPPNNPAVWYEVNYDEVKNCWKKNLPFTLGMLQIGNPSSSNYRGAFKLLESVEFGSVYEYIALETRGLEITNTGVTEPNFNYSNLELITLINGLHNKELWFTDNLSGGYFCENMAGISTISSGITTHTTALSVGEVFKGEQTAIRAGFRQGEISGALTYNKGAIGGTSFESDIGMSTQLTERGWQWTFDSSLNNDGGRNNPASVLHKADPNAGNERIYSASKIRGTDYIILKQLKP